MKSNLILILLSLAFANLSTAQLSRIVLQPATGDAPQVHLTLDAALASAQTNDRLYFSGGTFNSTEQITLDEPIHFIGAGIHPDSSAATTRTVISLSEILIITTSASNSTFTGLDLDTYIQYGNSDADDDPTGVVFERCAFRELVKVTSVLFSDPNTSSTVVNECVFFASIQGSDFSSLSATRCVIDDGAQIKSMDGGGLLVDHCVFLGASLISNSEFSTVQNCIFAVTGSSLYQCSNSSVSNSLTYQSEFFGNSSGTVSNSFTDQSNIFVDESNGQFDFTDDLSVVGGSVADNGAMDGTDMGLYGSPFPAKLGFVPYNPHYQVVSIDPATDGNGDLPVHIKVQAQTY